tara:strand:- start:299 stop:550 length:252 start_codon:yes stop_codon:yes gene_type:complete
MVIKMKDLIEKQGGVIRKQTGMINEINIEVEDVQDNANNIFDVIIQFKKTFEKSDWKKNRKINSIIKQLLRLEQQLSDETQEL